MLSLLYQPPDEPGEEHVNLELSTRRLEASVQTLKLVVGVEQLDQRRILRELLSPVARAAIPISTSASKRLHDGPPLAGANALVRVRAGTCGEVYQRVGTLKVYKLAKNEDWGRQLWNDFGAHLAIREAFRKLDFDVDIHISRPQTFVHKTNDAWWSKNGQYFPHDIDDPQHVLVSERILPLHPFARQALIDLYCHERLQKRVRDDSKNDDCLARVYLGRRRESPEPGPFFTLRNFRFTVDMFEEIELEAAPFALAMGQALAVLHWVVGCDARDVEFALGSAPINLDQSLPTVEESSALTEAIDATPRSLGSCGVRRRVSHFWLLDFNQVKRIRPDETGVEAAVQAYMLNDPYYPRPHSTHEGDIKLWEIFKGAYLGTSERLVRGGGAVALNCPVLAEGFIEGIIRAERRQLDEKAAIQRSFQGRS